MSGVGGKQGHVLEGQHSSPPRHEQRPPTQRSATLESHARPHAPQFSKLVWVSTQDAPQQLWPAGHAMPQPPQCAALSVVRTQTPPQHFCPPVHAGPAPHRQVPATQSSPSPQGGEQGTSAVQVPPWHTVPDGHALPHRPQFALSVAVLVQVDPQHV